MVTPCTDWYLIFSGLAKGNTTLGSSVLPLNLILQILLLPVYLWLFMGAEVSFDSVVILKSILLVLIVPLIFSNSINLIMNRLRMNTMLDSVRRKSDGIQFLLLCLAIISMFASEGTLLLQNISVFIILLPPLLVFFAVNFVISFLTGKTLGLSFENTVPLIFTTSARNSPVALAIAALTFPSQPVISLVLVMGPLIELPVLAVDAFILKKMGSRTRYPPR
jgi:ACR3 family arsenite efflux pump ArsB